MALTRRLQLLFALITLASCATGQPKVRVWSAPFAQQPVYSTSAPAPQPDAHGSPPELAQLESAIEISADSHGFSLQRDPRLSQLARFIAYTDAPHAPPTRLVELASRQLGMFDPSFDTIFFPVTAELARSPLPAAIVQKLRAQPFTHYGAFLLERSGRRWLTVVLTERRLALEPVPRSIAAGTPIRLRGRLPEEFRQPTVEVLTDRSRSVVPLGSSREFSVQLPTPTAGIYRLEILAQGKLAGVVLAKLPIYVGVPVPHEIALPEHERGYDFAAIAQQVFLSINRERAAAGLPALRRDPRLDALALQHSLDMRDHDFVGHKSARTGDPAQRVARAQLPAALVLETIARGGEPSALEASTAAPSGEVRNLLSPSITHAGIGVTAMYDPHGPTLVATELFIEQPERVEPITATPKLLALVNEARMKRGTTTLALDAGLCEVARQAVQKFMADPGASEQSVLAAADRELGRFSLAYRRVNALLAVTARLEDAAFLEPVLAADAGGLGIGIAQGPRSGTETLAVVMVVGTRR